MQDILSMKCCAPWRVYYATKMKMFNKALNAGCRLAMVIRRKD